MCICVERDIILEGHHHHHIMSRVPAREKNHIWRREKDNLCNRVFISTFHRKCLFGVDGELKGCLLNVYFHEVL